jgi:hypothetical protein
MMVAIDEILTRLADFHATPAARLDAWRAAHTQVFLKTVTVAEEVHSAELDQCTADAQVCTFDDECGEDSECEIEYDNDGSPEGVDDETALAKSLTSMSARADRPRRLSGLFPAPTPSTADTATARAARSRRETRQRRRRARVRP